MKNPKSLYVSSASRLKKTRQARNILLLSLLIMAILTLLFVFYVLGMQQKIDERFPSDPSAPPSSFAPSLSSTSEITSETDATSEPLSSVDPTPSSEISESAITGTETNEATETSKGPKKPEELPMQEDVYFAHFNLLQTITHKERDIAFGKLKQSVREYISDSSDKRIAIFYSNLKNGEEFGFNDLSPFVVGGAINLPINLILYEESRTGVLSFREVLEYTTADQLEGSGIIRTHEVGSQYYIRSLSHFSLTSADNIATAMILRRLGGIENVHDQFSEISSFVDFLSIYNYIDYAGKQQSGIHRSCAQDMGKYAGALYSLYLAYPDHYQTMINDLSTIHEQSGFQNAFASPYQIFGKAGRNSSLKSSAEISIIICQEPIVLSIIVESNSAAQSDLVMEELSKMVADYLSFCYS